MRKMKDSGIEWIGKIPEGWETWKSRYVFEFSTGLTITRGELMEEGIPCINYGEIHSKYGFDLDLSRDILKCADLNFLDNKKNSIVNNGDFIFCDTSEDLEGSGNCVYVSNSNNQNIFAGSHTIVARPIIDINSRYFAYLFSTNAWRTQIRSVVYGVKVFSITQNILKATKVIMPPLAIQKSISDYLDKKCAEIDLVIKAKETTNEKLKEYRQSIIYEAVTKGLDKNVPMKDSGIEWIGEIPEGWETWKIKHTSILRGRIGWQGLKADEFIEEGPFLITGTDFINGVIDWDSCVHITEERYEEAPNIHIVENDLLITKDGTIGKVAIALNCPEKASLNSGVFLIRNNGISNYINKYLYYVLISDVFWKWFNMNQNGNSTIIHLYQEQFSNFVFPIPKSETEQQQIADFLDQKCLQIDTVISANEKTIEKLKEYRQSVIYEAVTGKMEILSLISTGARQLRQGE